MHSRNQNPHPPPEQRTRPQNKQLPITILHIRAASSHSQNNLKTAPQQTMHFTTNSTTKQKAKEKKGEPASKYRTLNPLP
jgi:hypothetical protein